MSKVDPLCPVFGACGGCAYQDLPYEEELALKETALRNLLQSTINLPDSVFQPIVPSPEAYHYRNRLDLTFVRTRSGEHLLGFMPQGRRRVQPVTSCAIAKHEISDFLPTLFHEAREKLPPDYRRANLVVKTGEEGRVSWGGIGRRSLASSEADYLWVDIGGMRIFYSLDTFFQANLSILPAVMEQLAGGLGFDPETLFLDLYAGVGLFGVYFARRVAQVIMIEECAASLKLARYNVAYHELPRALVRAGKVEEELPAILAAPPPPVSRPSGTCQPTRLDRRVPRLAARGARSRTVALVDPPRRGLSKRACGVLCEARSLARLAYLSCSPQALARDLTDFVETGWQVRRVVPLDFFPKTQHLETLVFLERQ